MNPVIIELRPTTVSDLDFVLQLEGHPDNVPFIGFGVYLKRIVVEQTSRGLGRLAASRSRAC
jgi:hypothetical protein